MTRLRHSSLIRFFLPVAVLLTVTFVLACRLVEMPERKQGGDASWLATVLGESRVAIGDAFFEQADVVFHKGVGHFEPQAIDDIFTRWGHAIAPVAHSHLIGDATAEIMPWLYFALRADPHNVTAYGVAAFWLAGEIGRPDLAREVLAEARRENPHNYQVYKESGRLALKQNNLSRASLFFDTAIRLWSEYADQENEQSRLDAAEIYSFRGLLFENDGDFAQARICYQLSLEQVNHLALRQRMEFLEKEGRSPSSPFALWQQQLAQHSHVCEHDHEHDTVAGHEWNAAKENR